MRIGTLLAAALPGLMGCGNGEESPAGVADPANLRIAVASGDGQQAPVETSLPEFLVVRVTDGVQAVEDVAVAWEVVEGRGQISIKRGGRTDGQGLSAAVLFLGDQPGELFVSAALENGEEARFTARATPPLEPPATSRRGRLTPPPPPPSRS